MNQGQLGLDLYLMEMVNCILLYIVLVLGSRVRCL